MHILGKILLGLLILAAGAGTALMARQLQIRNSYAQKLEKVRETVKKNQKAIAEKEAQNANLRAELDKAMQGRRRYWDNRTARPRADGMGNKTLGIGVGTREGLGQQIPNVNVRKNVDFHVFRKLQGGGSIYIGRFVIRNPAQAAADSTVAYPDWNLNDVDWKAMGLEQMRRYKELQNLYQQRDAARQDLQSKQVQLKVAQSQTNPANNVTQLQAAVNQAQQRVDSLTQQAHALGWSLLDGLGNSWRIWAAIPGESSDLFTSFYFKLEALEREQRSTEAEYVASSVKLAKATADVEAIEQRIAGQDGTGGFVKELREAEDTRNAVLAQVDDMRRRVKTLVDERDRLIRENKSLPGK